MRGDKIKVGEPRRPRLETSEDKWRAIERALGLTEPNPDFRYRFASHLSPFLLQDGPPTFGELDGPKLSCVRKYLAKLVKDVQQPSQTFDWMLRAADEGNAHADMAVSMVIDQLGMILEREGLLPLKVNDPSSYVEVMGKAAEEFDLARAALSSNRLKGAAAAALNSLPKSQGGKPANKSLERLIRMLADFVEGVTGRKPGISFNGMYHGPFYRFVMATLDAFAPKQIKENGALGKTIQRVI